jgi:hypothetical protein
MDDRDVRALTDPMVVLESSAHLPDAPGMYAVTSSKVTEDGIQATEYHVDVRHGRCECDDHKYRNATCKHIRLAEFATGRRPLPAWVDDEDLPAEFARHVDGTPVREDEPQLRARVDAVHSEREVLE